MPLTAFRNNHFTPATARSGNRKKGPLDTSTPISRLPAVVQAKIELPSCTADSGPNLSMESSHGELSLDSINGKIDFDSPNDALSHQRKYNLRQRPRHEVRGFVEQGIKKNDFHALSKHPTKSKLPVRTGKRQLMNNAAQSPGKHFAFEVSPSLSEISPVVSTSEYRRSSRFVLRNDNVKRTLADELDYVPPLMEVSMSKKDLFGNRPGLLYFFHCLVCLIYAFVLFKLGIYFGVDRYFLGLWKEFH